MKKITATAITAVTVIAITAAMTLHSDNAIAANRELPSRQSPMYQTYQTEKSQMNYYMPSEDQPHEGTWITWPHSYTYGVKYRKKIEGIWVQMVQALHTGEKVHIVAYHQKEKVRIKKLLQAKRVDMKQIDFVIAKSDDVWARDTGPMFVFDEKDRLTIADFGFDGWGEKVEYENDDRIPSAAGKYKNIPVIDISDFVLEGGSIEMDGNGTMMACRSSVVSKNRNQDLTIQQAEDYLSQYLGIRNFIWLTGVTDEDITDAHIDGMARFLDDRTILTVSEEDFAELYESISMKDYQILQNARNAKGQPYDIEELPLTRKPVKGLDYKGSYFNYYIGNDVVLVPIYQDQNDEIALDIIADLYPEREIVPIDVTALFPYGGMIHCITQQQPR